MPFRRPVSLILPLLAAVACCGCSLSRKDGAPAPSAVGESAGISTPAASPSVNTSKPIEEKPAQVLNEARPEPPKSAQASIAQKILPAAGEEALNQIRDTDSRVPRVFLGLKRPADQYLADVESAMQLSKDFLADYPDTEAVCEVKAILGRMELARLPRHRDSLVALGLGSQEVNDKYREYTRGILALTESNAADCPTGSQARKTSLVVSMHLQERLDEHEKLRSTAAVLLREYPELDTRPNVHVTVAQSYINEQKYADAVKYLEEVIKLHAEDPEYVLYNDRLFDALTGVGNLEGMEDLMHLIREEYPTRLPTLEEGHYLRQEYEYWLCVSAFWIGYVRMALGDNPGARESFQKHVAEGDLRIRAAEIEGRKLGQDRCFITVEFRSKDLLDFLESFHGRLPRVEMDFQDLWATQEKLTLRDAKGKVVALVFRMPENRRAELFLQSIDGLVKSHKGSLVGATIGYVAGKPNPADDELLLQKMRDDLKRLQVSLPGGFDPDRKSQQFFREVHAVVGTPSFVVLNKKGEIAWYMNDPRDMDREIAKRVIERLLKE